ncbi:IclR family transcriptional regulator [Mycetocola spongiae]|uniref:IclR family transcriptional regulator n=1 Tax=Mycetocola spongiae TaxID=2859226 RepID=UPI001CF24CF7|nr:IclR family transcriptional regulator [Mycetocola spongiae]UCR88186.1 IclR family transcriptional regulator [Mycetocola spongiae]
MSDKALTKAEKPGTTTIQSVARASRILIAVAGTDEGLLAKEVADAQGLSLPTAYHLLATLVQEGLLFKDSRRRYVLGPQAEVVAAAIERNSAAPENYLVFLRQLAASTEETAYLSAWRNGEIAVLSSIEGSRAVRVSGLTGSHSDDLHARASGKLLLAYGTPELRERVIAASGFHPRTANTITSAKAFRAELEEIRRVGYAFDREEFELGVICVSAPILVGGTIVACLTVSTPSERFQQNREFIVDAVVAAAHAASS